MRETRVTEALLATLAATAVYGRSLDSYARAISQNNPMNIHYPYPAHLLRDHEVRLGIGEAVAIGVAKDSTAQVAHNYHLRVSESFYWGASESSRHV